MALELKTRGRTWYARFQIEGKTRLFNTGVAYEGRRPVSLREEGDRLFEASRQRALQEHERLRQDLERNHRAEDLVQKLHEIRTGNRIDSVRLDQLRDTWDSAPRKRKGTPRYVSQAHAVIDRFTRFVKEYHPTSSDTLGEVTPQMAEGFLLAEDKRGVAARTWNSILILMRSVFKAVARQANLGKNPFDGIPTKDEKTIHRIPFTVEELGRLLNASEEDKLLHPLIVVGACTAMRRGDCCELKWADIDLADGMLTVKTAKTGHMAEIPLLPMLRTLLDSLKRTDSPYVFPEQARMQQVNPNGLSYRLRKIFEKAGFVVDGPTATSFQVDRPDGMRRGSVRDFHSLRTTWITMALNAGVPLELVQRVTGHQTADVVLKHYFKPSRQDFKEKIGAAMPRMLGEMEPDKPAKMRALIEKLNGRNWRKVREALLELVTVT